MAAHVIETLSFDIGFATDAEARDQHGRIGDFARGGLLAAIDAVFDEFASGDEVIRLDRLEVDVGGEATTRLDSRK